MKKIVLFITAIFLTINLSAQDTKYKDDPDLKAKKEKYCVIMKEGKVIVLTSGKEIKEAVTLADGSRLKVDGSITKTDGLEVFLKPGECVDQDGNIMQTKSNEKEDKKESVMPPND